MTRQTLESQLEFGFVKDIDKFWLDKKTEEALYKSLAIASPELVPLAYLYIRWLMKVYE